MLVSIRQALKLMKFNTENTYAIAIDSAILLIKEQKRMPYLLYIKEHIQNVRYVDCAKNLPSLHELEYIYVNNKYLKLTKDKYLSRNKTFTPGSVYYFDFNAEMRGYTHIDEKYSALNVVRIYLEQRSRNVF